jgi:uncharacterized membrane protein
MRKAAYLGLIGLYRWIVGTLVAGLWAVLPLVITLYLVWWVLSLAESFLAGLIKMVLPSGEDGANPYYIPGMGVALLVAIFFAVGLALKNRKLQRLGELEDKILCKIPFVRKLYGSVKELRQYFQSDRDDGMGDPVLVTLPGTSVQLMGFITRRDTGDSPRRD